MDRLFFTTERENAAMAQKSARIALGANLYHIRIDGASSVRANGSVICPIGWVVSIPVGRPWIANIYNDH